LDQLIGDHYFNDYILTCQFVNKKNSRAKLEFKKTKSFAFDKFSHSSLIKLEISVLFCSASFITIIDNIEFYQIALKVSVGSRWYFPGGE